MLPKPTVFMQINGLNISLNKITLIIGLVLISIPILFGFYFIWCYGVNVPQWDQWRAIVSLTLDYYNGRFSFLQLLNTSNDSRLFFPSIVMLFVSLITDLNIKILFFIAYLFNVLSFLLIAILILKDLKVLNFCFLALIPISFYWFSPYYLLRYIYNSGGFTYAFLILFLIISVILIDKSKKSDNIICLAIISAVICTFSGAIGSILWIVGIVQIILQSTNNKVKKLLIWIFSAIIVNYIFYFALGFNKSSPHGPSGYYSFILTALTYPFQKFLCFMGVLGSQVINHKETALIVGILLLCILIAIIINNRHDLLTDTLSKWYALLIFWLGTSLALALSRSGALNISIFGPADTIYFIPHFRHTPTYFFSLIAIYVIILIYTIHTHNKNKQNLNLDTKQQSNMEKTNFINIFLLGMVFTLLLCGILFHFGPGITSGKNEFDKSLNLTHYVLNFNQTSKEKLKLVYPDLKMVRPLVYQLEKYNLSLFSKGEKEQISALGASINKSVHLIEPEKTPPNQPAMNPQPELINDD